MRASGLLASLPGVGVSQMLTVGFTVRFFYALTWSRLSTKYSTRRGRSKLLVSLWPSCPYLPKVKRAPWPSSPLDLGAAPLQEGNSVHAPKCWV